MSGTSSVFEKLWYAALVISVLGLAFTGFEIHGTYQIIGFRAGTLIHDVLTAVVVALGVIYVFWALVTGHRMGRGFGSGGQRVTGSLLTLVIWGVMLLSGLLYIGFVIFHDFFATNISREAVAYTHTAGAFLVLALGVWHIYFHFTRRG